MNGAAPATEPSPFLRQVIECWDPLVSRLTSADREQVRSLVTGSTEPVERLARVRAVLFRGLSPDDPLWRALFGSDVGIRMASASRPPDAASLARLAELASASPSPPRPVRQPALADLPDWRSLHRRVRESLDQVPYVAADPAAPFARDPAALVRLRYGRDDVRVPRFQLDDDQRLLPVVADVNRLLGADRDPWGAACWWLYRHPWIGARPVDLIGAQGPRLVAAARSVQEG